MSLADTLLPTTGRVAYDTDGFGIFEIGDAKKGYQSGLESIGLLSSS